MSAISFDAPQRVGAQYTCPGVCVKGLARLIR